MRSVIVCDACNFGLKNRFQLVCQRLDLSIYLGDVDLRSLRKVRGDGIHLNHERLQHVDGIYTTSKLSRRATCHAKQEGGRHPRTLSRSYARAWRTRWDHRGHNTSGK